MSSYGAKTWSFFGPWRGINEFPNETRPDQLEDAWNVDFRDGAIVRRKGRRILNRQGFISRCSAVYRVDLSATIEDGVEGLDFAEVTYGSHKDTNDNKSTAIANGLLDINGMVATEYLLVMMPFPVQSHTFTLGTANTTGGVTLAEDYWNGTDWTSMTVTAGSTAWNSAGPTTLAVTAPSPWTLERPLTIKGLNGYWRRIRVVGGTIAGGATINTIRCDLYTSTTYLTQPHCNGLYVWRPRNGRRRIIFAADLAGIPMASNLLGRDFAYNDIVPTGLARLFEYNEEDGQFTPLPLPAACRASGNAARWSFATYNNHLIATNGYGPPIQYNGQEVSILECLYGEDKDLAVGYLPTPPKGRYLNVYNSALYSAGALDAQNFMAWTAEGTSGVVPDGSVLGGASLWPNDNFTKVGETDDAITGAAVLGSDQVVWKQNSIWTWDGIDLKQRIQGTGCVAPASLVVIGQVAVFLASEGVYAYDGRSLTKLSGPVEKTLRNGIQRARMSEAVAVKDGRNNEYLLWLPGLFNTICLVYNYSQDSWTKRGMPADASTTVQTVNSNTTSEYSATAAYSFEDPDYGETLFTAFRGAIYVENYGVVDEDFNLPTSNAVVNRGIAPIIVPKRVSLEDYNRDLWRYVRFLADTTGAVLTLRTLTDSTNWKTLPSGDTITFAETSDPWFNTSSGGHNSTTANFRTPRPNWSKLSNTYRGRYIQLVIDDFTDDIPFKLYGFELSSRTQQGKEANRI